MKTVKEKIYLLYIHRNRRRALLYERGLSGFTIYKYAMLVYYTGENTRYRRRKSEREKKRGEGKRKKKKHRRTRAHVGIHTHHRRSGNAITSNHIDASPTDCDLV